MTTLLAWLSKTHPLWAHDVILNWEDVFIRRDAKDMLWFVVREIHEQKTTVDMRNVVGQRDHYAGQTWLEAVLNPAWKPEKIQHCLSEFERNPTYYFSGEINGGVHLSSVDGRCWFSDGGGNHRAVIAKFACDMIHAKTGEYPLVRGVNKSTFMFHEDAWQLYLLLREYDGIYPTVQQREISRTSETLKTLINYALRFHVSDSRFGRQGRHQHLEPSEFCDYARWVISNGGVPSRYDKLAHYWQWWFGDQEKLIYKQGA